MSMERLTQVLVAPHVSEKSALLADTANQHVFKVLPSASKQEIKSAVEQLFQVKVASVRVANVQGKNKRFGRVMGKRSDWKKAYVRLETGHDIDLTGME
ncbi:MAG: 50S ribosomal protein L23 [Gammaproteobacteria bacterium]|nr:50S ribosomal protein L23 [Gammaproteobacteria bacterium]